MTALERRPVPVARPSAERTLGPSKCVDASERNWSRWRRAVHVWHGLTRMRRTEVRCPFPFDVTGRIVVVTCFRGDVTGRHDVTVEEASLRPYAESILLRIRSPITSDSTRYADTRIILPLYRVFKNDSYIGVEFTHEALDRPETIHARPPCWLRVRVRATD